MVDKAKRTIFLQNPIAYSERPSGNNQSQCTMQSTQYFCIRQTHQNNY